MHVARLVWLSFVTALPAQVLIVDINNGPGTTHTSLAAAAAVAPDGATLLVMPGNYPGPVAIVGKGLTILGTPFASIASGGLRIENSSPTQTNTVRSLAVAGPTSPPYSIVWLWNCQGRVVLENVGAVSPPVLSGGAAWALNAVNCPQVALRGSTFAGGSQVHNAHVAAEGCTFTGMGAQWGPTIGTPGFSARPAIHVAGTLQLVNSSAQGGAGACQGGWCVAPPVWPFDNKPAIELSGGTTVLRASVTLTGGATFAQGPAITGSGTVRIDPAVVTNGAVAVSPSPQVVAMPSLRSTSAALGGTLTASATGPSGSLLLLLLGLPGPAVSVPGIADPLWMEPAGHMYAAIGTAQPLISSITVPVVPGLLGFPVSWHAIAFDPTTNALLASQPSIAFVF